MNVRVLVDLVGPFFDQPFRPGLIHVTPDKIVFSSRDKSVKSKSVKPIFEILDVPLQIGMVSIGRSTDTSTHNLAFGDNDRHIRRRIFSMTNRYTKSDVGNIVCTAWQIEVCKHGIGTFDRNGHLKYDMK